MISMDLDSCIVRSDEPVGAAVSDGLLMLSVEQAKYFSLNATAAAIWGRLESPIRVRDLSDQIVAEFDTTSEQANKAVLEFVTKLFELKIVAVHSACSSRSDSAGGWG